MYSGLKNQVNYKEICSSQKVSRRGSVIALQDKYYYVYGEEGPFLLVFEISDFYCSNDFDIIEIKLGNGCFYTTFKDEKINKDGNFTCIYNSNEKEIDYVKKLRKKYKAQEKASIKIFNVGSIVEHINSGKRYIIIKKCDKTYECFPMNSLKNASCISIHMYGEFLKLSENKNLEGIKWFEDNTDFNLENINDEKVINQIIETQKKYIKYDKPQDLKMDCAKDSGFHMGTIVKLNEDSKAEYIVKTIIGNILCCENKEEQNGMGTTYYFNKDNVVVVENPKIKKIVIRKRK